MSKLLFYTLLFSSFVSTRAQHFECSFLLQDNNSNVEILKLGTDAYATDGLDPQLGEEIVPQEPPGNFGVRFQLPTDTSIYTLNDFRFRCDQPYYYEHLIDISYESADDTIEIYWDWYYDFSIFDFINPYTGLLIERYEIFFDSSHFVIPNELDKLIIGVYYDGPITFPIFDLIAPDGGDNLVSGEQYNITWWSNWSFPPIGNLEFSTDAGKNWTVIADSIPHNQYNYNYFLWTVPYLSSDSCLVRVGEFPCYCDVSESLFTITYPVQVEGENVLPTMFSLSQNYPNPFNPSTKIKFEIPAVGTRDRVSVQLKVYDVLGNEVATLVNEEKSAGNYEIEFNSSNLSSGIYFYTLSAGNYFATKKMILLR